MSLRISRLCVDYGKKRIIDHLTMPAVPAGSLVALLGANAVGKSTVLRSLAGLKSASGEVTLADVDLLRMPQLERVQKVGYLPQALPQSNSLLVWEALCSGLRALRPDLTGAEVDRAAEAALRQLGIVDLAMRPLNTLSGGQRQMVGLSQVLVRQPELLLLDEPTSALDLRWQLAVLRVLREVCAATGAIAVIAIHDINLALRYCDTIAVLRHGRLLAAGPAWQTVTPELLHDAFDIDARVENCSLGHPIVVTDGVGAQFAAHL